MQNYQYNQSTNTYFKTMDMSSVISLFHQSSGGRRSRIKEKGVLGVDSILALSSLMERNCKTHNGPLYTAKEDGSGLVFTKEGEECYKQLVSTLAGSEINDDLFTSDGKLTKEGITGYTTILEEYAQEKGVPLFNAKGYFTENGIKAFKNMQAVSNDPSIESVKDKWPYPPVEYKPNSGPKMFAVPNIDSSQQFLEDIINENIPGPCFNEIGGLTPKGVGAMLMNFWNNTYVPEMQKLYSQNYDNLKVRFGDVVDLATIKLTDKGNEIYRYLIGERPILKPGQLENNIKKIKNEMNDIDNYSFRIAAGLTDFVSLINKFNVDDCSFVKKDGGLIFGSRFNTYVTTEIDSEKYSKDGKSRIVIPQKVENPYNLPDKNKFDPDDPATYQYKYLDKLNYIQDSTSDYESKKLKYKPTDREKLRKVPFYPADDNYELNALDLACKAQHATYSFENNPIANLFGFVIGRYRKVLYNTLLDCFNKVIILNMSDKYSSGKTNDSDIGTFKKGYILIENEKLEKSLLGIGSEGWKYSTISKSNLALYLGFKSFDSVPNNYKYIINQEIINFNKERLTSIMRLTNHIQQRYTNLSNSDEVPLTVLNKLGYIISRKGVQDNLGGDIVFEKAQSHLDTSQNNSDFDFTSTNIVYSKKGAIEIDQYKPKDKDKVNNEITAGKIAIDVTEVANQFIHPLKSLFEIISQRIFGWR